MKGLQSALWELGERNRNLEMANAKAEQKVQELSRLLACMSQRDIALAEEKEPLTPVTPGTPAGLHVAASNPRRAMAESLELHRLSAKWRQEENLKLQQQIADLRHQHKASLAQVQKRHRMMLEATAKDYEQKITDIAQAHREEKELLSAHAETREEQLQNRIENVTSRALLAEQEREELWSSLRELQQQGDEQHSGDDDDEVEEEEEKGDGEGSRHAMVQSISQSDSIGVGGGDDEEDGGAEGGSAWGRRDPYPEGSALHDTKDRRVVSNGARERGHGAAVAVAAEDGRGDRDDDDDDGGDDDGRQQGPSKTVGPSNNHHTSSATATTTTTTTTATTTTTTPSTRSALEEHGHTAGTDVKQHHPPSVDVEQQRQEPPPQATENPPKQPNALGSPRRVRLSPQDLQQLRGTVSRAIQSNDVNVMRGEVARAMGDLGFSGEDIREFNANIDKIARRKSEEGGGSGGSGGSGGGFSTQKAVKLAIFEAMKELLSDQNRVVLTAISGE